MALGNILYNYMSDEYCRWKLSSENVYTFNRLKQQQLRKMQFDFSSYSWLGLIHIYKFSLDNFHLQYS
jgi:hypothetical protein